MSWQCTAVVSSHPETPSLFSYLHSHRTASYGRAPLRAKCGLLRSIHGLQLATARLTFCETMRRLSAPAIAVRIAPRLVGRGLSDPFNWPIAAAVSRQSGGHPAEYALQRAITGSPLLGTKFTATETPLRRGTRRKTAFCSIHWPKSTPFTAASPAAVALTGRAAYHSHKKAMRSFVPLLSRWPTTLGKRDQGDHRRRDEFRDAPNKSQVARWPTH